MIEAARAQAEPTRSARERGAQAAGLAGVLPRPRLVLAAGWLLATARALRLDRLAPPAQRASTPPATLREMLLPIPQRLGAGPTATVLSGCVMEVAFRPVQRATMRAVAAAGHLAVRTAPGACCGALAMHHGQPEAAREMARARIPELEAGEIVVVNASGCSAHVRAYGELLADDPAWAERAERVAAKVLDLIELERPSATAASGGSRCTMRATTSTRSASTRARCCSAPAPTAVDLGDGGRCCGAAGLDSVLQPELAGRLRRQKAEAIAAAGAPVVAVANPGCAIQIAAGLREIGSTTRRAPRRAGGARATGISRDAVVPGSGGTG